MPRLRHTVEQILAKLREAEVALIRASPSPKSVGAWASPNKPTIVGAMSMVASRSIKPSASRNWNARTAG